MIDILKVLDRANDEVSEALKAYCLESGKIAVRVCVTAKVKREKEIMVCRLFSEHETDAAKPETAATNPATNPKVESKSAKVSARSKHGRRLRRSE